jgi:pseudouridine kinase
MSRRERQILAIIRDEPMVSQNEIARRLSISRSAVAGHIMRLTSRGIIRGRGYLLDEQPYVVCIGGANLDIRGKADEPLTRGESIPGAIAMSPGGVVRNVAENLVRLGLRSRLFTLVGDDQHGEYLLSQARSAGIDTGLVQTVPGSRTSTYLSILDQRGDTRLAINDMGILDGLDPALIDRNRENLQRAAVIVADANLRRDTLEHLAAEFREQPLFVDAVSAAKSVRLEAVLHAIDTLKMTRREAMALAGRRRGLSSLAGWYRRRGVRRVFITLGAEGVFYSTAGDEGLVDARPVTDASSTSGAGDAFLAGLVYSRTCGHGLERSIGIAMSAARLTLGDETNVAARLNAAELEASIRVPGSRPR